MTPQPGDFVVIQTGSIVTIPIEIGELLSGGGFSQFNHAAICSRIRADGTVMIVEAEPQGAVEVPWHYDGCEHLWSTGRVPTSPAAGAAALGLLGVSYGWLDYAAIALHAWHIPFPGLRGFIAHGHTLICSQLVDAAELLAGVHLFHDGRWPGYVRPSDLADLILSSNGGI